jgi:hypothetical protein
VKPSVPKGKSVVTGLTNLKLVDWKNLICKVEIRLSSKFTTSLVPGRADVQNFVPDQVLK